VVYKYARIPQAYNVYSLLKGGLFHAGSATMYRAKYFMDEDVILVTLNYRLAALGNNCFTPLALNYILYYFGKAYG